MMRPIQMVDLTTQYARFQAELHDAIGQVLRSGKYINGESVSEFAANLAAFTGAKYVVPCANGTDALQISLMALDLQPGDEVLVPAFNYIAAAEAVALLKLSPVLVDVNPQTFNMDVNKIEQAITQKTKAIIPVHLFGQTTDMEPLMQSARNYHLSVIEDNAQSIGAVYTFSDGTQKQAGTIGDIGTLSFFPTKNLGGYGDGGAILTNNEVLAKKLKMIASHGQSQKYRHELIGCNSRLDTLQAAILNIKLAHLQEFIAARQQTAQQYNTGLHNINNIEIPYCAPNSTHVYHQYTLKINNGKRNDWQQQLKEKGIPTMIYYPLPLQKQPAYQYIAHAGSDLSASIELAHSVLSLPMHTELDSEQIEYIVEQVMSYQL